MTRRLHVTRRELVASATVAGALAAVPPAWGRSLLSRRARVGPGSFFDGVATGEPTDRAVTFWSRLETERPRSGARLVVARDAGLRRVVATAIVPTGPGVNGTLKARVGGLRPSTEYFYVWESGTAVSPVGRTRTAPPAGAAQPLRMAFSSCQNYSDGYFGAHADVARLEALEAVLFLGDYIYERAQQNIRRDPIAAVDLSSYRGKYALYRSDPALRELHRLHPTLHVWDDHELVNNYTSDDPPPAAAQRTAAYRAAFEWLPRMTFPAERHRIYKQLSFGSVADVFLLDERQYRTGRNGDGQPRRILGDAQMGWLIEALKRSRATWKLIAQQVVVAPRDDEDRRMNPDAWDGYPDDRTLLLSEIERAGIGNVVVLTGDAHVFKTNLLASDFSALAEGRSGPCAVEYVGGSVTSPGRDVAEAEMTRNAPWTLQYHGGRHGYTQLALDPQQLVVQYLSNPVGDPGPPSAVFERFVQPSGANRPSRESFVRRST